MAGGRGKCVMVIVPSLAKCQQCTHKIIPAFITRVIVMGAKQVAGGIDAPGGMMYEKQSDETAPEHASEKARPTLRPQPAKNAWKNNSSGDPPKIQLTQSQDHAVADQVWDKPEIRLMRMSEHPSDVRMPATFKNPTPSSARKMGGMRIPFLVAVSVMLPVARTPKNDGALSGHASGDSQECFDGSHTLETSMSEKSVISKGDPQHGDSVHPQTKSKIKHGDPISKKPVDGTQKNEKWSDDRDNGHGSRRNPRGL